MAIMRLKIKVLDQKGKVGLGFSMDHVKIAQKNVQRHDLSIDNIMLHWKSDGSMKIGVQLGTLLHTVKNVESMWHAKTKDAKDKLKKEKFKVAPKLFRIPIKRHQDPSKY